jgi:outer membrane lipoprotein LolB
MGGLRAICSPLLLSLLLVLSGCASLSGWFSSPRESAARAAPFDILGRVLVSYDGRAFTANVRWLHTADSDDLWLMTPTGQALAYLREDSAGATLTSADQTQYRATQIESLSKRALDWELPIRRLQYWVRGAAAPDVQSKIIERNDGGRTRLLAQDGWRITYDYYPATQNDGLPRRIEVVSAAQTMRLVIDTWRNDSVAP